MTVLLVLVACQPVDESADVPVTCTGIPTEICEETEWWQDSPYRPPRLVAVEVTCDGACDQYSGGASVALVLDNGYRAGYSYHWDGAPTPSR
jgi:hypothetical protein